MAPNNGFIDLNQTPGNGSGDGPLPGSTGGTPSAPGFWGTWGGPIATGAGGVVGAITARKAQQDAMKRSPEELAALAGAGGAASGAGGAASSLMGTAKPYLGQAGNYYQTLLHGNRAAMANATAAPRAQLQEAYRGAKTGLAQSGIRGAAKDVLAGNLSRQGAGQVAGLTTGVQPAAAQALGALGTSMSQTAVPLYNTSGNIYSQMLNNGLYNRMNAQTEGGKAGSAAGKLTADIGNSVATALSKRTTQPKTSTPGDIPNKKGKSTTGPNGEPAGNYPQPPPTPPYLGPVQDDAYDPQLEAPPVDNDQSNYDWTT